MHSFLASIATIASNTTILKFPFAFVRSKLVTEPSVIAITMQLTFTVVAFSSQAILEPIYTVSPDCIFTGSDGLDSLLYLKLHRSFQNIVNINPFTFTEEPF